MEFLWACPEPVGTPPSPRSGHSAVMLDPHTLLVYGGFVPPRAPGDEPVYSREAYLLDTDQLVWSRARFGGSQPPASVGGAMVRSSDRVYLVCGFTGEGFDNDVYTIGFGETGAVWAKAELATRGDEPPGAGTPLPSAPVATAFGSVPCDGFAFTAVEGVAGQPQAEAVLWGGWDLEQYGTDVTVLVHEAARESRSYAGFHPALRQVHDRVYDVALEAIRPGRPAADEAPLQRLRGRYENSSSEEDSSDEDDAPSAEEPETGAGAGAAAGARAEELVLRRRGHSVTRVGSSDVLVVFGGACGYDTFVSALMGLDVSQEPMRWVPLRAQGREPCPRAWHSASGGQRNMVVYGGLGYGGVLGDVWVLDLDPLVWSVPAVRGDPPPPRAAHTALLSGSALLIFGGHSGDPLEGVLGDVHVLQLAEGMVEGLPTPSVAAASLAQSLRPARVNGQALHQASAPADSVSPLVPAARPKPKPRRSSRMFLHMRASGVFPPVPPVPPVPSGEDGAEP